MGPNNDEVKLLYSDGAHEIASSARLLHWRHDRSTPHRPLSGGVAERAVGRTLEVT